MKNSFTTKGMTVRDVWAPVALLALGAAVIVLELLRRV